ncbi:hypothetical protein TNCT_386601 [Trichonephila clavata]|uniref:Uncharacterized protein n=1 Tax=Trichonephila clavata TaxID=2740835 RepID=A0A8X6H4F0_TRICU|nr:hypothetical protein TNCT_386601 [Trichonephila clavata]
MVTFKLIQKARLHYPRAQEWPCLQILVPYSRYSAHQNRFRFLSLYRRPSSTKKSATQQYYGPFLFWLEMTVFLISRLTGTDDGGSGRQIAASRSHPSSRELIYRLLRFFPVYCWAIDSWEDPPPID